MTGDARRRWALGLAGTGSILAFVVGTATFRPLAIAVFLAVWWLPLLLRPALVSAAAGGWPLWGIPLVGALSATWSRAPFVSLRAAVELAALLMAAGVAARLLGTRGVLHAVVGGLGVATAVSLVAGDGAAAATGIFAAKNELALFCGILAYASLAVALAPGGFAMRMTAAAMLVLAVVVGLDARSAGATAATAVTLCAVALLSLLGRLPRPARRWGLIASGAMAAMLVAAAVLIPSPDDVAAALRWIGKDPGLTGRAYLWARGADAVADRPWLGYGFQAFWLPRFDDALGLYRYAGIASETGFHFHNLLLEARVEMGVAGVAAVVVLFTGVGVAAIGAFDRRGDAGAVFAVATVVFFAVRAGVEVDFLAAFATGQLFFALAYGVARNGR